MERYLVTIGSDGGEQRELRVEASSEEAAVEVAAEQLEGGESVVGLIVDPDPGRDPDEWAGAL